MQTVFITGTSSGIGRATAIALDQAGFRVIAGVRNQEDITSLKLLLSEKSHVILIDVTDAESVQNAGGKIKEILDGASIYALINNAGVDEFIPVEALPLDRLRNIFEVNLFGAIRMTKALMPLLRKSQGRIINICSKTPTSKSPFSFPFCASKSALEAFTQSLRAEVADWNIDVISIKPSAILSKTSNGLMNQVNESLMLFTDEYKELYREKLIESAKKVCEKHSKVSKPPEEVAKTIVKALQSKKPKKDYQVGSRQISL